MAYSFYMDSSALAKRYVPETGSELVDEILVHRRPVRKMPITNRLAINAFPLIVTHSINSTDAIALKSALAIADKLRVRGDDLVLVASDQRLLRAAQAEGLKVAPKTGAIAPRNLWEMAILSFSLGRDGRQ